MLNNNAPYVRIFIPIICFLALYPASLLAQNTSSSLAGYGHITMGGISVYSEVAYIGGTAGQSTQPTFFTTDDFLLHSGFWYPTWYGIVADVPNSDVFSYALQRNIPNPFNPSTTIRYSLAALSNVTIEIFDLNGCLVNRIAEGPKGPGSYSSIWNGRNSQDQEVGSGVYLVRVIAGKFQDSIKVTLVK